MTGVIGRMIEIAPPGGAALADWRPGCGVASRRIRPAAHGRVRLTVMVMALIIGATNGGLFVLTPKRPWAVQVFSVAAGLSPLSRLEVGGWAAAGNPSPRPAVLAALASGVGAWAEARNG